MDAVTGRQFHNQPEKSHLHGFLVDLWDEVRRETAGALDISVHAQNAGIAGSDPAALKMLVAGEVEFIVLMGGLTYFVRYTKLGKAMRATAHSAMLCWHPTRTTSSRGWPTWGAKARSRCAWTPSACCPPPTRSAGRS
jgi:hypothetical protein